MISTRFRPLLTACLLAGLAVPASAAIRVDFDRDGGLDTARFVAGVHPQIRIAFENGPRVFVLPVHERLATLAAADVDQDGLTDLVGHNRFGVVVWKNLGNGRFAALPRRGLTRSVSDLAAGLTRVSRPVYGAPLDAVDLDANRADDQHAVALLSSRSLDDVVFLALGSTVATNARPRAPAVRLLPSRAPPAHNR